MWHYVVVKHQVQSRLSLGNSTEDMFSIHEAYLSPSGKRIKGMTKNKIAPYGESLESAKEDVKRMLTAFSRPVIQCDGSDCDYCSIGESK